MPAHVTRHLCRRATAVVTLALLLGPTAAFAQNAVEDCIQQGYRPGTTGFYQCLQNAAASQRASESESPDTGEAGSILGGDADNAVTDYSSGSSMEGATTPDPEILKQLNTGTRPSQ